MSFLPSQIGFLAIWYDASRLPPGSLSSWPDLSGRGNHGTITGSPNPTVIASPADLPGQKNVVRFTASEGHVLISSGTGVTTNWTLAYVARVVGPTSARVVGSQFSGGAVDVRIGYWNGLEDVLYDNGFPGGVTPTTPAFSTNWKLYSASGVGGDPTRLYSNGTLLTQVAANQGAGFGNTFAISGFDSTTAETSDVQVAEVVLYSIGISSTQRQSVEAYLREKWLLPAGPNLPPQFFGRGAA